MLACRSVKTRGTARSFLIAQSLTTHASTQPAVGAAKHHRQNAYFTAMFRYYVGGYFNLRHNSPLSIDNNMGYSVAHALVGPQSLKFFSLTFEARYAGSLPYSSATFRCTVWKRLGKQSEMQQCQLLWQAITVSWNPQHVVTALK